MAIEVFKLFGSIFVNNDEANKSIAKTDKKASGVAGTLGKGIKTAAKWGTAILGGATAAAGGLVKMAEKSAETTDHIDKMSQKIGISRKSYQELDFICSQTGASVDSLKVGLKTMRSVMDQTASGSSKTATALERLGVSATDGNGKLRDSEEVMWESLEALQKMENQTEKARLATKLFGKSGTELMPLLNGSADSIENMKNKANELGLVLDDKTIDSGVKFTDTLDQTKRAATSLFTKLGSAFLPMLTKLMEGAQKHLPFISQMFQSIAPVFTSFLDKFLPPLGQLAKTLLPLLLSLFSVLSPVLSDVASTIMPILIEVLQMALPPLIQIIQSLLPPLVRIIQSLLPIFTTLFEVLKPIFELVINLVNPIEKLISSAIAPLIEMVSGFINDFLAPFIPLITEISGVLTDTLTPVFEALQPVFEAISTALKPIFTMISELVKILLPLLTPVIKVVAQLLSGVLGSAIKGISDILSGLANVFNGLIEFLSGVFTGNWKKIWSGIKKIFKGVWDTFWGIVKLPINLIIDGINFLWKGIYAAVKGIVDSIGGVAGALGDIFGQDWHFSMPEEPPLIPKLAKGGVLEEGQVGLLEGDGDEAVVPLSQNTEWIDKVASKLGQKVLTFGNSDNFSTDEDIDNSVSITNYNTFQINGVDINNDDDLRTFAVKLSTILVEIILNQRGAFA